MQGKVGRVECRVHGSDIANDPMGDERPSDIRCSAHEGQGKFGDEKGISKERRKDRRRGKLFVDRHQQIFGKRNQRIRQFGMGTQRSRKSARITDTRSTCAQQYDAVGVSEGWNIINAQFIVTDLIDR